MAQDIVTLAIRSCHLVILGPDPKGPMIISQLEDLFNTIGLPVSKCADEFIDVSILGRLTDEIGPPRDKDNRKVVLLCGAFLEEQVSVSTHHLLMNGFEIYLIRDLIVPRDVSNASIHDSRLATAGAVSVTARQLIYEWIASEREAQTRSLLTDLVARL